MISDLQLIELLHENLRSVYVDDVDSEGNPVVYYLHAKDGKLVSVEQVREWRCPAKIVWERPVSDESIARAAKLIASSTYGKTYPHQGDCSDSDWNGSH